MELLLILILILLGIILPIKTFKPLFILLAAITTFWGTITLPYITNINGNIITYSTVEPIIQWALGLILLATTVILYLDSIDGEKKDDTN